MAPAVVTMVLGSATATGAKVAPSGFGSAGDVLNGGLVAMLLPHEEFPQMLVHLALLPAILPRAVPYPFSPFGVTWSMVGCSG